MDLEQDGTTSIFHSKELVSIPRKCRGGSPMQAYLSAPGNQVNLVDSHPGVKRICNFVQ